MENNDTNTDYHTFVSLGDQKWEIVEILKKLTPTESANSHPKSQFDLSPSYLNVLKNGSASPLPHPSTAPYITHGRGRGVCELWSMPNAFSFNFQRFHTVRGLQKTVLETENEKDT